MTYALIALFAVLVSIDIIITVILVLRRRRLRQQQQQQQQQTKKEPEEPLEDQPYLPYPDYFMYPEYVSPYVYTVFLRRKFLPREYES